MLYFLKIDRVNVKPKENMSKDWILSERYLSKEREANERIYSKQLCKAQILCLDRHDRMLGDIFEDVCKEMGFWEWSINDRMFPHAP